MPVRTNPPSGLRNPLVFPTLLAPAFVPFILFHGKVKTVVLWKLDRLSRRLMNTAVPLVVALFTTIPLSVNVPKSCTVVYPLLPVAAKFRIVLTSGFGSVSQLLAVLQLPEVPVVQLLVFQV